MRVLLMEDDGAAALSIKLMLKTEGFDVYRTDLGQEGIQLGILYDYDIILLDLNLPERSELEALRSLLTPKLKTPILILCGLAGINDTVKSLGLRADFLIKPFDKIELVDRIHTVVRCSGTGSLSVNLDHETVKVAGVDVHVTRKEYEVLKLLSLYKDTTLTKELLLNHLYDGVDKPELKIIDVFVCNLRKKLANAGNGTNYIETVRGQGYALCKPRDYKDRHAD
jgi:two-component system, cell cycle response regulator CtrA